MSETESLSERELADQLAEELYSGKPRSVGEALAAAEPTPAEIEEGAPQPPPAEPPVVVTDEPVQPDQPEPDERVPAESEAEEVRQAEADDAEELEGLAEADPNVVWAKKKYGEDTAKWAKAAYDQEQHISRMAGKLKEAETLAEQWYEYAQSVEQQQPQVQMPLSAQEEQWADQALANPVQYAYQAVLNGNMGLYNAIIERVAYQNPRQASAVETEVRLQVMAAAEAEQQAGAPQDFQATLAAAVQRAGIDVPTYGQAMIEKITELGELHPYVQTIMEGDDSAREIALMAVLDMVRSSSLSTRKVRDTARDEQIKREAQLRKEAAGVVTGGGSRNPPQRQSPFMQAMEDEWKARGQWKEE